MSSNRHRILAALAGLSLGAASAAAAAELVLPRPSPKASLTQTVGLTDITLSYSRPGVKGRTVWGDLVPYDKVWRTGANEATTIQFSDEVEIQGQKLPAGKYSFHTLPTRGDWTVIFNKEADQWGSYSYKPEADALRVTIKPRPAEHMEWMSFSIPTLTQDSCELVLHWEKLQVAIPIKTRTMEAGLAAIDKAMTATKAEAWRVPYRAAEFCLNNDIKLDQAMTWVDQSIAAEANFFNHQMKAKLQAKAGDTKGAIVTAEKALALQKASGNPPDTAPLEKLIAEWKGKK